VCPYREAPGSTSAAPSRILPSQTIAPSPVPTIARPMTSSHLIEATISSIACVVPVGYFATENVLLSRSPAAFSAKATPMLLSAADHVTVGVGPGGCRWKAGSRRPDRRRAAAYLPEEYFALCPRCPAMTTDAVGWRWVKSRCRTWKYPIPRFCRRPLERQRAGHAPPCLSKHDSRCHRLSAESL